MWRGFAIIATPMPSQKYGSESVGAARPRRSPTVTGRSSTKGVAPRGNVPAVSFSVSHKPILNESSITHLPLGLGKVPHSQMNRLDRLDSPDLYPGEYHAQTRPCYKFDKPRQSCYTTPGLFSEGCVFRVLVRQGLHGREYSLAMQGMIRKKRIFPHFTVQLNHSRLEKTLLLNCVLSWEY